MFGGGVRVAIALALSGCAGQLSSRASTTEWSEVASAHFVMWTHGDIADARHTLQEMEHQRSIVLGVAFPTADSRNKTLVVAFRDRNETLHYLPEHVAAITRSRTPLFEPIIVMAADADALNERLLTHELTHAISYQFIHRQPAWFAEGLASFFETVKLDPDSADVVVGEPSPERTAFVRRRQLDPVADAFACATLACHTGEFYATAWALVTYLLNEHPTELARYEQALIGAGHGALPAWSDVAPELATPELQRQLGLWLVRGRHTVWKYKLHLQIWPTTVRRLGDADIHAIEGLVIQSIDPKESAAELATALRLEPTNLVANLAVAARDHGVSVEAGRALVGAHPDDWRAWRLYGMALHGDDARAAFAKMCELLAKDPQADPPPGLTCSTVAP